MKSTGINEKRSMPLYERVTADLKREIDNGLYKVGDLLPSENELCTSYNTTRPTVRHALSRLTNMGYITRHKGKGSIVIEPKKALGILSISGVTAGVGLKKLRTLILQKPIEMPWPADLRNEVSEAEQKVGCIYFTRLRVIDNKPVLFEETFISNLQLEHFTKCNLENRSLFQTLHERYNVEIKGGMQRTWAKKADKSISGFLNIKRNSPVVYMRRKLKTNIKDLNIYSWLHCNTEEYYLEDHF
jgi:DNA-binding GntR family transcriptional regulator